MTTTKKAGIFMDHATAHVIEFEDALNTAAVLSEFTHEEKEKSHQKSESLMHRKEQQEQAEYYKAIGESVKNYDEVLLFGPTSARVELLNILKTDTHFNHIVIHTLPADNLTENQEHAFVRNYFQNGDRHQAVI